MDAGFTELLPGALARGALTALVIGVLLLSAQRFGRGAAGLLAGLPTVTGPAMLWLALDRGEAFAAAAAVGAVAAGIACAVFALGYGLASRRHGPLAALGIALLASALPLPWLALPEWSRAKLKQPLCRLKSKAFGPSFQRQSRKPQFPLDPWTGRPR